MPAKNLRCSLVTTKKGVTGLYGKDGYEVEKPISRGIERKVSENQDQEGEGADSG
ncbi:hypothetical protein ACFLVE_02300 [Chloroflexota bacterium]